MEMQARSKRALVTGSTAGIEFAAAAGLFAEWASVVVTGRTKQRVEEAVAKMNASGGNGEIVSCPEWDQLSDHDPVVARFRPWGVVTKG